MCGMQQACHARCLMHGWPCALLSAWPAIPSRLPCMTRGSLDPAKSQSSKYTTAVPASMGGGKQGAMQHLLRQGLGSVGSCSCRSRSPPACHGWSGASMASSSSSSSSSSAPAVLSPRCARRLRSVKDILRGPDYTLCPKIARKMPKKYPRMRKNSESLVLGPGAAMPRSSSLE